MKKGLLSVIIPVFNAEDSIELCINSIINQTYKNIEIIIIDDGSMDNSFQICKKLEEQEEKLKVIHIENRGAAFARNVGIFNASGEYITFIDADDYLIDLQIYELSINQFSIKNVDLVVFGWQNYNMETSTYENVFPTDNEIVLDANLISPVIIKDNFRYGGGYPWNKIWRSEIINSNNFIYNTNLFAYEDKLFVLQCLSGCRNVKIINRIGYRYNIYNTSLSHNNENIMNIYCNGIDAYKLIEDYFFKIKNNNLSELAKLYRYELIIYRVNMARKENNLSYGIKIYNYMKESFKDILTSKISFKLKLLSIINYLWLLVRVEKA